MLAQVKKNEQKREFFLCLPLLLTLILSLELGSCWASEKGGDFLLDKHVINLREHILSHRKITKGEMSGVVTQAGPSDCCGLNWPPPMHNNLFPLHIQQTDFPTLLYKATCCLFFVLIKKDL